MRVDTMTVWEAERISVNSSSQYRAAYLFLSIGLPPIVNFARPALRDKIIPQVLDGKKLVCLCISEAFAGSDVAGLKCHAKRVADGWVVTGTCVVFTHLQA
jgi:alkylation response protein AidB-like acyl-CoA dehydrogenase